jgi:hypothetical protein
LINNQHALSNIIGTYGAWGCLAENADDAIAVYNICQLDRFEISFDEIIDMIRKVHGFRLKGWLGTKFFAAQKVLYKLDFDVHFQGRWESIGQVIQHRYFYIFYKNDDWGRHCQAGWLLNSNHFELFNTNHIYDSIEQFREFEKVTGPIWLFTVD